MDLETTHDTHMPLLTVFRTVPLPLGLILHIKYSLFNSHTRTYNLLSLHLTKRVNGLLYNIFLVGFYNKFSFLIRPALSVRDQTLLNY